MAKVSDLVSMVAPRIPDAPDPIIEDEAVACLQDFCRRTKVWRERLGPLKTIPNFEYFSLADFSIGSGFIFDLETVNIEGRPLEFGDQHRAVSKGLFGRTGVPEMFDHLTGDELLLYPTPDRAYTISGIGFVVPNAGATEYPDFLHNRWSRGLLHGTLFMLASMKRKPWTDPELANDSAIMYQDAINTATAYAEGANQKKDRTMSYGGY